MLLKAQSEKHYVLSLNGYLPKSNKRYSWLVLKQSNGSLVTRVSKRDSSYYTDKDKVVSITYEEIGLFPRSFSRVLDRFLKQLFSDVDNLVIQEYRFYRYLFLRATRIATIKTIFILFFVPFLVNFVAKNYVVKPITEFFWNKSHPEIFLNSYQQKRAFAELEKFEEKIYFETLVESYSQNLDSFKGKENAGPPENFSKNVTSCYMEPIQDFSKVTAGDKFSDKPNSFLGLWRDACAWPKANFTNLEREQRKFFSLNSSSLQKQKGEEQISVQDQRQIKYSPTIIGQSQSTSSVISSRLALDHEYVTTNVVPWDAVTSQQGVQTRKNKDISKLYQEKTIELATYYNNQSIEAITNFFADLLSLCTLLYLLITLEIQINITKSFLLEVFFGLDDSKKSLLILLITDLLVGYHSSNLWELFFEFLFNHYGIPESQTGIFLLVATLPVLLDVLFKYLIFRHLNRSSPATVATYQAIIE
nr:envelope membrane protein [Eudorina cylindrica]